LLDLDDVAEAKEELEKNLINQIVLACAEFDITHPEEA
jgi:precorrin isomerase